MLTLQKTFESSSLGDEGIGELIIEAVFPQFDFRFNNGNIERFVKTHNKFLLSHNIDDEEYRLQLPLSRVTGKDSQTIYGFFLYHFIEILNANNINDFSFPFTINLKSTTGQNLASEQFEALMLKKKSASSDYDRRGYDEEKNDFESTFGPLDKLNNEGLRTLPTEANQLCYLINKKTYELFKYALEASMPEISISDAAVIDFIDVLVDLSDGYPQLITDADIINYTQLVEMMRQREWQLNSELYRHISDNFDQLFDFPLALKAIETIDIAGVLQIESEQELNLTDFSFYELSVEFPQASGIISILRYDWRNTTANVTGNQLPFAFENDDAIISNNVAGRIKIRVKNYDGATLWSKTFQTKDEQLQNLIINIPLSHSGLQNSGNAWPIAQLNKRLRGRVIQNGNNYELSDLTVVIQAKKSEEDEFFRIVAATQTDKSGNFSVDYPYGHYAQAQALVSLMPNSPAELAIDAESLDESIRDDFIFLLLSDESVIDQSDEKSDAHHDDCECHDTKKAHRLPDQADLIASDEYTQDIGGSCLNLTTPNRTLKEYSYNAIVRTSDPDVANYVLQKRIDGDRVYYDLVGGSEKLERGVVDLDNPIRWEDAPDAKENLSIYQAVTVATGHIVHFKSIFKADGYSLGDLVYSLPLAPGQKKEIVVFESSHTLQGAETQSLSQGESLTAGLVSDRFITDQLSGGINESLSGRSRAHTSGMSAGLGASGSYGGIGASLGVAGGFSNSNSSASQNSARNISQFFGEKLRQSLMQNAESYRELNASVVTTVTQGQDYGVTSEVVANHNHCHALTMMYFEVLRHYAIYQDVSHVEECLFVPLMLTQFSTDNIHKWKDVLATNLLPIPSSTYLKWNWSEFLRFGQSHPLIKGFDANSRIKTNYSRVDFPLGTYAQESIRNITGEFTLRVKIQRPKTRYDRILSFPRVSRTIENQEFDPIETAKAWFNPFDWNKTKYKTTYETVVENARLFDSFMRLDADFQNKKPSQVIRVMNFEEVPETTVDDEGNPLNITISGKDFFEGDVIDKQIWEAYAEILGYSDVYAMLNNYFRGALISEWDYIFNNQLVPDLFEKLLLTIRLQHIDLDINNTTDYRGGERRIRVRINSGSYSGARESLPDKIDLYVVSSAVSDLQAGSIRLDVENVRINYTTAYHQGILFNGYLGDDLINGTSLYIPLTDQDLRNPRKEDAYIVAELIEHLNSNIEHYNKVLWANLDKDRRYLLLDGFNIQTYHRNGERAAMRSLASVVKNEIISIAGNSLVFPVADGFKVNRQGMVEDDSGQQPNENENLLAMYKPVTPVPPYRISVPTRGVFMEAIQGNCDACEMVKENSSQDWDKFRTEEPTPIQPIVTPTPSISPYQPQYKDFAQPIVNIQNAPDQPAPAAGLANLGQQLANAGAFNDVTGLAKNQDNAIRTYLSNQENAKAFAEMSKSLATQQHNTANSGDISEGIERARRSGSISPEDAQDLTRQHLQQQIDGGESSRERQQFEREQNRPSLTSVASDAASRGQSVQAERTDSDGTRESIDISGEREDSGRIDVFHEISIIEQPDSMSCWAASATMMVNWKNRTNETIVEVLRNAGANLEPSDENHYVDMFENESGLSTEEKPRLLNALNMVSEPNASFGVERYIDWLRTYGPLWVTIDSSETGEFSPHARILYRIQGNPNTSLEDVEMTFADPATGNSQTESFPEFIRQYEDMVFNNDSGEVFVQIVHFSEAIQVTEGSGGSSGNRALFNQFIDRYGEERFRNSAEINAFFTRVTGLDFCHWFNQRVGNRDEWAENHGQSGRTIPTRNIETHIANFNRVWDRIPELYTGDTAEHEINLFQFFALICIIINETGGTFVPIRERGSLSYLFGTNGGRKRSYNNYPPHRPNNRTAFSLFNDEVFLNAHSDKLLYDRVENTTNRAWAGDTYPAGFPTNADEAGIIAEADFNKFAGRGLVQTTWRRRYEALIGHIMDYYAGTDMIIREYQNEWRELRDRGLSTSDIASHSSNVDWERLFMDTENEFAAIAVYLFQSASGNFLEIPVDANRLLRQSQGSLYYVGYRVGGRSQYGEKVRNRIIQMMRRIIQDHNALES